MSINGVNHDATHQHLAELISMLRNEVQEFRTEMREGLAQRPTHVELGAVNQLFTTHLDNLRSQMSQQEEYHGNKLKELREQAVERTAKLREDIGKENTERKKLEEDLKKMKEKSADLNRNFLISLALMVLGFVATNVGRFFA